MLILKEKNFEKLIKNDIRIYEKLVKLPVVKEVITEPVFY